MNARYVPWARIGGWSSSRWPLSAAGLVLLLAAVLAEPPRARANGTAYYLDVNWPNPGLGLPSGTYLQNGNYWTTDPTGLTAPVALPASVQMTFGATASDFSGAAFTINMNSGNNWTGLLINSTNANVTLIGTANSYLNGAQTWTVAAGSTLNEAMTWSAGGLNFNFVALTLNGGGTINFQTSLGYNSTGLITENDAGAGLTVNLYSTNITFSGGYTLTSGTLNFAGPWATNALGTGAFTLNGGTVDNTSGGPLTLTGMSGISLAANFTFGGTANLSLGNLPVTSLGALVAAPAITVRSNTLTIPGIISGAGGLTKAGAGVLNLPAYNTYSGPTILNAGLMVVPTGGACANSGLTINSGATNSVQVLTAGGQWSCGGLTVGSGTAYADFYFSTAPSTTLAPLLVNGNVAFNGALNVILRSGTSILPGTYPLIKYTGSLSGTPPATLFVLPPLMAATLVNNLANQSIDLKVTVGNQLAWAVGSGVWDIGVTPSWKNSSGTASTYGEGESVLFDDSASGASPINVTLNATVNPAGVLASPATKTYVIGGSGGIAGAAPLVKNGAGTLTLNGANAYTGGTTVNAGLLQVTSGTGLGDANGPLTITGGTLDLGGNTPNVGVVNLTGGVAQNGTLYAAAVNANTAAGTAALLNTTLTTSGALTVNGAGGLFLNGDQNLGGPITDLGTLNLTNANNMTTTGNSPFFVGINGTNGVVNQASGLVNLGQNYGSYSLLLGNGSTGTTGIYNLSGGTLTVANGLGLGINNGCSALFNVSGGALNALGTLEIGRNYASTLSTTNTFTQTGGAVYAANLFLAANTNQLGVLNLTNCAFTASNFVKLAASPGTVAQVNVGPGAVATLGAFPSPDPTALAANNINLVINGGTLAPFAPSATYMPGGTFSTFKIGPTATINVPAGNNIAIGQAIAHVTSGNNNLVKSGAGALTLTGLNTYDATTTVAQGTLRVNSPGYLTCLSTRVASGATLGGSGLIPIVVVSNGATLWPGSSESGPGQMTVVAGTRGSVTFAAGAMLTVNLANVINAANNSYLAVKTGVTNAYPLIVNLNLLNGVPALNQPYNLITNAGSFGPNFLANLVVGSSRYVPTFAISGKFLTVTFTNLDPNLSQLVWQGDGPAGTNVWMAGFTNEWLNGYSTPTFFETGDAVTFNDAASSYNVNLVGSLLPASVSVNAANTYTFQGNGAIGGATAVNKGGPGTLVLNTTNTYTGATTISNNAGSVIATIISPLQNTLGAGPVSVGAGATLQLNSTITASGAATYIGNALTGAGHLMLDFAAGTSARNTYVTNAFAFGGLIELANAGGTADKWNITPGVYPATVQIDPGCQLFPTTAGTVAVNGIWAQGTGNTENRGAIRMGLAGAVLAAPIWLQGDTTIGMESPGAVISGGITNTTPNPVTLVDGTANSSGAGTFAGTLSDGPAGGTLALVTAGAGTLTLATNNTFSGPTTINTGAIFLTHPSALSNSLVSANSFVVNGLTFGSGLGAFTLGGITGSGTWNLQDVSLLPVKLIVGNNNQSSAYDGGLIGPGSLVKTGAGALTLSAGATPVYAGVTAVSNGTLYVNSLTFGSNTVTVAANATLGGAGTINGAVTVLAGGTLAPGPANGVIGMLTLASNLTLSAGGYTAICLDKGNGMYDQVGGLANVSYGGTLVVSNLSGTLASGDSFPIFSAAAHAGNFTTIAGSPGPGLNYSFNPATGVLSVTATGSGPVANPDIATTYWNVPVTIAPLADDTDPNAYPLTVTSVSATNGTAAIINGGLNVLFTPLTGSTNSGFVAYTIGNGHGGTANSLITITLLRPPKPTIKTATRSAAGLILGGIGGAPNGTYRVLASTNAALARTNWVPVLTNTFDASGNFSVTNAILPAVPKNFFLLEQ